MGVLVVRTGAGSRSVAAGLLHLSPFGKVVSRAHQLTDRRGSLVDRDSGHESMLPERCVRIAPMAKTCSILGANPRSSMDSAVRASGVHAPRPRRRKTGRRGRLGRVPSDLAPLRSMPRAMALVPEVLRITANLTT